MSPATQDHAGSRPWLGVLAILVGLAWNKWSIERLAAPDEHIASALFAALIACFQLTAGGLGSWWIWKRPGIRLSGRAASIAGTGMAALLLLGIYGNLRALRIVDPYRERRLAWQEINAAENLLMALTPELRKLGDSVADLSLPDFRSGHLFGDEVILKDLAGGGIEDLVLPAVSITVRERQESGEEGLVAKAELSLWRPLLDRVSYFVQARFRFVEGHFVGPARDLYETELHFEGLARMKGDRWISVDVDQRVLWRRAPEAGDAEPGWRIAAWRTDHWTVQESDERLFTEVLAAAVVDAEDLKRARRSNHEDKVREYLANPEKIRASHPYFTPRSVGFHPGIAVVDLDRDGFDDIYATQRWGANLFLRNRGDGTFDEVARDLGLDARDHTSSAVFADFDNDGDADAVLGRTLAPSLYLVNENGRFVDRSSTHVDGSMPCLATSLSVVDYDADGLLDVYVSTFGAAMQFYLEDDPGGVMARCLSEADLETWKRLRSAKDHALWNYAGPANVMLRNRGHGRFETVRLKPEIYRNTFQSTWSDYDGDGDPDVYLANDYAPNNLLRNEGGGKFTDVTAQTGTADVGFGMGASWGDFDNDGRHDLYVTNMYSKAGRRITRQMPEIDSRLPRMSRGNSLFRNAPGGFQKLSGTTPDTLQVEKVGWSWGGQFADLDNDGFLDVYALSGFFTAPQPFALPHDL